MTVNNLKIPVTRVHLFDWSANRNQSNRQLTLALFAFELPELNEFHCCLSYLPSIMNSSVQKAVTGWLNKTYHDMLHMICYKWYESCCMSHAVWTVFHLAFTWVEHHQQGLVANPKVYCNLGEYFVLKMAKITLFAITHRSYPVERLGTSLIFSVAVNVITALLFGRGRHWNSVPYKDNSRYYQELYHHQIDGELLRPLWHKPYTSFPKYN